MQLLPYQPFEQLPNVLASADVLIVVLEDLAGPFSVPSKTLSYLCAGRAILGSMPVDNTAARIIDERADAGIVVGPSDIHGFCEAARALAADPAKRAAFGNAARRYAEANFGEEIVLAKFRRELGAALLHS